MFRLLGLVMLTLAVAAPAARPKPKAKARVGIRKPAPRKPASAVAAPTAPAVAAAPAPPPVQSSAPPPVKPAASTDPANDFPLGISVNVLAGYAGVSTGDSPRQVSWREGRTNRAVEGGAMVELEWDRFVGVRTEILYGMGWKGAFETVNRITGAIDSRDRTLVYWSGMLEGFGAYPFRVLGVSGKLWAAPGFGLMQMFENTPIQGTTSADGRGVRMSGLYGAVGISLGPFAGLGIYADYGSSLTVSATDRITAAGAAMVVDIPRARFERIRAGIFYRVIAALQVGVMYRRAHFRYAPVDNSDIREAREQVLGTLGYQF